MTRHFYKHLVTGIVASLEDAFAEAFEGRFERVDAPAEDDVVLDQPQPVEIPANSAPAEDDAATPDDASVNPANSGVNP